jgi:hypothetical protein
MAHSYSFKVSVVDLEPSSRPPGLAVENRVSSGKEPPYPDGLTRL